MSDTLTTSWLVHNLKMNKFYILASLFTSTSILWKVPVRPALHLDKFVRRNLKNCPISCCKTAYIALVWSVLEYGSIVWGPYLTRDIDKLERIQRNGTRFITGDYKSRHEGAVTNMLKDLDLPTIQDRRTNAKLVFLYKVVEGLVPAIDPDTFI